MPLVLIAGEVSLGDNRETVQNSLGAPRGRAQVGDRELLRFDRGEVELMSGVVTRVALRSEQDQTAFEARQEANASRLTVEGEALKASKLTDSNFLSASPRYQLEFWLDFARRYPNVPAMDQVALARNKLYEQTRIERAQANDTQRIEEVTNPEPVDKTYYPIFPQFYGGYDYGWRGSRRDRLDWEYRHRLAQNHRRTAGEQDHDFRQNHPTGVKPRNAAPPALSVPGQNVMDWDGTRLPGEAPSSQRSNFRVR